ncbi:MAG: ATP-binding protein [Bacteroidota bacterium]|nr:ATP-binding protein [Bacteroidota bacterium]
MRYKLAIASGKGGTGKTSIAVNLAALMAENPPANVNQVLLSDMDVEEPNASLFFNNPTCMLRQDEHRLVPEWDKHKCTFCEKCANVCEFNALAYLKTKVMIFPDLCHSCHACSTLCPEDALPMKKHKMGESAYFKPEYENLSLIENRLDIGQPSAVPLISKAIENLENAAIDNSFVIMDAPPGTSCPMMEVTKNADFVLMVTEPTPFGLHDLKIAVETVKKIKRPMAVVLNKAGSGRDELIESYCKKEGLDIVGKIPQSQQVAEAYSRGELVYIWNNEIGTAWQQLGNNLKKHMQL